MNVAIAAAVFPIIFLGELPDKTMFASLVMSARGKPWAVWVGAAAAFAVQVVIAVTIGTALYRLVPRSVLDGIVAALFFGGAILAVREAVRAHEPRPIVEGHRALMTAFVVIFLAEWGDLTQILTANLAAHYHSPVSVGVGATLALWAVSGLAIVGGQGILRVVNIKTVRLVTAVILIGLGGFAIWQAVR